MADLRPDVLAVSIITPPAGLNPAVEGALQPRVMPAWVGPCALAVGAGVLWVYRRTSRERGAPAEPPPILFPRTLAASEIETLRVVLRLTLRARRQGRALTSGELVCALPDIVRVGALLKQGGLSGRVSAASSALAPGADDVAAGPVFVDEALDEMLAEQRTRLSGLAQKLGVAGAAFERVLQQEMFVGNIEALGVARGRAIDCLAAFCDAHALPPPTALCRAYAEATLLPHASSDWAPVCLQSVGHAFMGRQVLAYDPDRLVEWAMPNHADAPNAISMWRAVALPRECRPKSVVGLVPPAIFKTRALLRAMVQQLTENSVRQWWGKQGRDGALVDRVVLTLAPVWGCVPSPAVAMDEWVAAVSRFLMDLAWGEHVPSCYQDRWALGQILSQAVSRLSDPQDALRAWFKNDSRALDELGRCVLQEANQLRDSWLRAWSVRP